MKINNWTLLILFAALLLAAFLPQWLSAINPDMSEIKDAGMSGALIATILGVFKMLHGKSE